MKSNYKLIILLIILIVLLISGCNRDNYDAIDIKLTDSDVKIKDTDIVKFSDGIIYITQGGNYRFTGTGSNVQILVDSDEDVTLILDDVQIVNDKISGIKVESKSSVTIKSVGENDNSIQLTGEDSKQCVKAEGALTVSGETLLYLEGENGIKAKELHIIDAWIDFYQTDTAIKANEIYITDSYIDIEGPYDGGYGIYAKDTVELIQSNISIVSANDCIHSEDSITIDGGLISLATYDDAIHAKNSVTITSGTIKISKSLEGIEGADITIYGGIIEIAADNDGINAASKDDDSISSITINGGEISINADGDGLDANGSIYINGGVLFVSGAYGGNNNAIDFDDDFIISGGAVIAAGNNLDAKPPSSKSSQNSVMIIFDDMQRADIGLTLVDETDSVLLAADFFKSYDNLIISLPELKIGKEYYFGETIAVADDLKYPIVDDNTNFDLKFNTQFKITSNVTLVWK